MGKIYIFGDNIDTDVIIPGPYLSFTEPEVLAKHCMEGYDPTLAERLEEGDIFVAGRNFGCGSSREQAPASIRAAGVTCIIAKSFARIFYRNAINIGMPVLEIPSAVDDAEEGDELRVDLELGLVKNISKGTQYHFAPFPDNLLAIIQAGGLKRYYQAKNKSE